MQTVAEWALNLGVATLIITGIGTVLVLAGAAVAWCRR